MTVSGPPLVIRSKIGLIGNPKVGKTAIVAALNKQEFPKSYNMTMGLDVTTKAIPVPNRNVVVELHILDCGSFEPKILTPHWSDLSAYCLVYDQTNPQSFEELHKWRDMLEKSLAKHTGFPNVSGFLLGNKSDLTPHDGASEERQRYSASVSEEQAQQLADDWGCGFFATSALDESSITTPFQQLAEGIYERYEARKAELNSI